MLGERLPGLLGQRCYLPAAGQDGRTHYRDAPEVDERQGHLRRLILGGERKGCRMFEGEDARMDRWVYVREWAHHGYEATSVVVLNLAVVGDKDGPPDQAMR